MIKDIKICKLCSKKYMGNINANYDICPDEHLCKCEQCNKSIILTNSKKDWFRISQIIKNGIVFCCNKCSIQYNHHKRFVEKYKDLSVLIKYDYENTVIQKKQLADKYVISCGVLDKIINEFNLIRPEYLKKEMYSIKSKTQYQNMSEESKKRMQENLSERGLKFWNSVTPEYRKLHGQKTRNVWFNKPEEERKAIVDKVKQTKANKTQKEHDLYRKRISEGITEFWKEKSDEEKQEIFLKGQHTKQLKGNIDCIASDGKMFDSSFEKDVYEFCLRNNLKVETQLPVKFTLDNIEHTTYIDFKIEGILFECKGEHLLNGLFDDKHDYNIDDKLKVYNQFNVLMIIEKCSENTLKDKNKKLFSSGKLIGIDIDLFKNTKFPRKLIKTEKYESNIKDISLKNIWQDEGLRWNIILQLLNQNLDFIGTRDILNYLVENKYFKEM